uniref:GST N-terminal domain-containing protein n=1 Tax=Glossina brevipalpis TaxID=37001 RepID=A0A1A9X4U5_9MUSC
MSCNCCCSVPILYYDDLSPQARSCYMLIKVLEIDVELKPINLINGEHFSEEYSKINPSCTVPALIDGNLTLYDGHTIMIYLCDKFAHAYNPQLCPKRYLTRLEVLNLLFYEGCVLYRRHSHLLTDILLEKFSNVDIDYHKRKISDCYNALNTFLIGHCFMVGNCMTIADFSMISTVGALDLMFPINRNLWPNLSTWFDRLRVMPWYKLNEDGINKQRKLLQAVGEFPFPSPLIITELMTPHSSFRADGYESMINQVLHEDESIKRQQISETVISQDVHEDELDETQGISDQIPPEVETVERQRKSDTTITRSSREEAYETTQILYEDESQGAPGTVAALVLRGEDREEEERMERSSVDMRKDRSSIGSRTERLSVTSRTEKSSVTSRAERSSIASRTGKTSNGSRTERSSFGLRTETSLTEIKVERSYTDSQKERLEIGDLSERPEMDERLERSSRASRQERSEVDQRLERLSRDSPKEKQEIDQRSERSSRDSPKERKEFEVRSEKSSRDSPKEKSEIDQRSERSSRDSPKEKSEIDQRSERSSRSSRKERPEIERSERPSRDSRKERPEIDERSERSSRSPRKERPEIDQRSEKSSRDSPKEKPEIDQRSERSSRDSPKEKPEVDQRSERSSRDSPKERPELDERSERSSRSAREERREFDERSGRTSRGSRREEEQTERPAYDASRPSAEARAERSSIEARAERSSIEARAERSSIVARTETASADSRREKTSFDAQAERSSVEARTEKSSIDARADKAMIAARTERSVMEARSERSSTAIRSEKSPHEVQTGSEWSTSSPTKKKEYLTGDEQDVAQYAQQGFIETLKTEQEQQQAPQTTEMDVPDMVSSISKLSVDNREFYREGDVEPLHDGDLKGTGDESDKYEGDDGTCACIKDVRKSYFEIKNLLKRQSEEFKKAIQKYPEFLTARAKRHKGSCICPDCAVENLGQDRYDTQRMKLELEFYRKSVCEPESVRIVNCCECGKGQNQCRNDNYYCGEDYEASALMRLKEKHERPGGGQSMNYDEDYIESNTYQNCFRTLNTDQIYKLQAIAEQSGIAYNGDNDENEDTEYYDDIEENDDSDVDDDNDENFMQNAENLQNSQNDFASKSEEDLEDQSRNSLQISEDVGSYLGLPSSHFELKNKSSKSTRYLCLCTKPSICCCTDCSQHTAENSKNLCPKSKAQIFFCQHGETEVPPELKNFNASIKNLNANAWANAFETPKSTNKFDNGNPNYHPAFNSIDSTTQSPNQKGASVRNNVKKQMEVSNDVSQKEKENKAPGRIKDCNKAKDDQRWHSTSAQTIHNFGRALSDTILNTAKYNSEGKLYMSNSSGIQTSDRPSPEQSSNKVKKEYPKENIVNVIENDDTLGASKKAVGEHRENQGTYAFRKESKHKMDDSKQNYDVNTEYEDSRKSSFNNQQNVIRNRNDDNNRIIYDGSKNTKDERNGQTNEKISESFPQQPEKSKSNTKIQQNQALIPNNESDQKISTYTKTEEKCMCRRSKTSSRQRQYPSPPCSLADFRKCSVCREKRKLQIDSQSKRYKIEIEAKGCKDYTHIHFGQKPVAEEKEFADKNKFNGVGNKDNNKEYKAKNDKNIRLRAGNCGSKHLQICYMDKDVLIKMPQDLKSLIEKEDSSDGVDADAEGDDNLNSDSLCSLTSISNASEEIACINYYDHYKDQRPVNESNRICFHHSKYLCRRCLKTLTSLSPKEACVMPHMYGGKECMGTAPLQAASGCHDLTKPGIFTIPHYSGCVCGCKCRRCLFKSVFNYPGDSSQLWSEYVRYPAYEEDMDNIYELPKVNSTLFEVKDKAKRKAMSRQQAGEDSHVKPNVSEINKFSNLKQHLTPESRTLFLFSENDDDSDNEKKSGSFNFPKTFDDRKSHDKLRTPYHQKLKKLTFSTSSENKIFSEPVPEVNVKYYNRDSSTTQCSKSRIPRLLMQKRVNRSQNSPTRETISNDEKASRTNITNSFYEFGNSSKNDAETIATKKPTFAVPSLKRRSRKFFWCPKKSDKKRESLI